MKFDTLSRHTGKNNPYPAVYSTNGTPSSDDKSPPQQTRSVCDEAPEARRKRVTELRHQVRSGTYEIPFSQLVRILASIFLKRR